MLGTRLFYWVIFLVGNEVNTHCHIAFNWYIIYSKHEVNDVSMIRIIIVRIKTKGGTLFRIIVDRVETSKLRFACSTGNARENLSTGSGRISHAMFMFRLQLKQCATSAFLVQLRLIIIIPRKSLITEIIRKK